MLVGLNFLIKVKSTTLVKDIPYFFHYHSAHILDKLLKIIINVPLEILNTLELCVKNNPVVKYLPSHSLSQLKGIRVIVAFTAPSHFNHKLFLLKFDLTNLFYNVVQLQHSMLILTTDKWLIQFFFYYLKLLDALVYLHELLHRQ